MAEVVRMSPRQERLHLITIRKKFDIAKLIYVASSMLKAEKEHVAMNKQVAEDIKNDYEFYKEAYKL